MSQKAGQKSRKEAAEKLEAYNNDTRKGIYIEPNKYTLSPWIDEWYRKYAVNRVKPTTRRDYEIIINKFIIPYLGYHKLIDLKSGDIQEFYNKLSVEKLKYGKSVLSPARVKSIHKV